MGWDSVCQAFLKETVEVRKWIPRAEFFHISACKDWLVQCRRWQSNLFEVSTFILGDGQWQNLYVQWWLDFAADRWSKSSVERHHWHQQISRGRWLGPWGGWRHPGNDSSAQRPSASSKSGSSILFCWNPNTKSKSWILRSDFADDGSVKERVLKPKKTSKRHTLVTPWQVTTTCHAFN